MAITGIATFDEREELVGWKEKYSDRPRVVQDLIDEMLTDCRYAVPCLTFQPTNRLPLNKLREEIDNFIVPRMYYYIDDLPLLEYLKCNLVPTGEMLIHRFDTIEDEDIC